MKIVPDVLRLCVGWRLLTWSDMDFFFTMTKIGCIMLGVRHLVIWFARAMACHITCRCEIRNSIYECFSGEHVRLWDATDIWCIILDYSRKPTKVTSSMFGIANGRGSLFPDFWFFNFFCDWLSEAKQNRLDEIKIPESTSIKQSCLEWKTQPEQWFVNFNAFLWKPRVSFLAAMSNCRRSVRIIWLIRLRWRRLMTQNVIAKILVVSSF